MTRFPFYDLHSFREFVVFAGACLPDRFPERAGRLAADEPWTLERVFDGLRKGLADAVAERGQTADLVQCTELVERAFQAYIAGRARDGQFALKEVTGILEAILLG